MEAEAAHLGRHLVLIAESDLNDPRLVRSREVGGYGLSAQWSDDFHHALHTVLTGEQDGYYQDFGDIEHLAHVLEHVFYYDGRHSGYRQRRHGRPIAGLSGHRFLGYLQNHDQIGNRAKGDRIGHLLSPGKQRIGAALALTSPFVPMLFQGEEWSAATPFLYFTDFDEPELAKAVSDGRRKEFEAFGWSPDEVPDPQDPETFRRSKLDWSELKNPSHKATLAWYQSLIRLRRSLPALKDGRLDRARSRWGADWLTLTRGTILVLCNLSKAAQWLPIEGWPEAAGREPRVLLASGGEIVLERDRVSLPGESVVILGAETGAA